MGSSNYANARLLCVILTVCVLLATIGVYIACMVINSKEPKKCVEVLGQKACVTVSYDKKQVRDRYIFYSLSGFVNLATAGFGIAMVLVMQKPTGLLVYVAMALFNAIWLGVTVGDKEVAHNALGSMLGLWILIAAVTLWMVIEQDTMTSYQIAQRLCLMFTVAVTICILIVFVLFMVRIKYVLDECEKNGVKGCMSDQKKFYGFTSAYLVMLVPVAFGIFVVKFKPTFLLLAVYALLALAQAITLCVFADQTFLDMRHSKEKDIASQSYLLHELGAIIGHWFLVMITATWMAREVLQSPSGSGTD